MLQSSRTTPPSPALRREAREPPSQDALGNDPMDAMTSRHATTFAALLILLLWLALLLILRTPL